MDGFVTSHGWPSKEEGVGVIFHQLVFHCNEYSCKAEKGNSDQRGWVKNYPWLVVKLQSECGYDVNAPEHVGERRTDIAEKIMEGSDELFWKVSFHLV